MKKNILWISLCAPYDTVGHGGGKTHNYYLKKVFSSGFFNIDLITFCDLDEYDIAEKDLNSYGIKHVLIPWVHSISLSTIKRKLHLLNMLHNPFNQYGGATNEYYWEKIKETICKGNYEPDIVILQWTEIALFADRIKRLFPGIKIIAIEEDVKFLASYRLITVADNLIKRQIAIRKYRALRRKELFELGYADLVITYSKKDEILLNEGGIEKTMVVSPYFENYSFIKRSESECKDILFYGAMSRRDNYESAIWFIENVFNKIKQRDVRFLVVGNKPVEKLKKYGNERILITGFVESVIPYFQECLFLVAPLVSGAGIKIKVLEALSAGIPVLTNEIGIEGINAVDGKHYIHCETSDEYINAINEILEGKIDMEKYSQNSKELILENYNLESDVNKLVNALLIV